MRREWSRKSDSSHGKALIVQETTSLCGALEPELGHEYRGGEKLTMS